MVTNLGVPACSAVNSRSIYVDGITYAIQKLGALTNVATYLDIGHSGCAESSTEHPWLWCCADVRVAADANG